jgi:hypothetical protein
VHQLGFTALGLAVQKSSQILNDFLHKKVLEYWMISSLKIKLN